MKYMKYLLLIILGLLAFQVAHSQLPDDTTGDIDISSFLDEEAEEEQVEEQASGVGEALVEEENASGVGEAIEEEENEAEQEAVEESGVFEEAVEVDSGIIEELHSDEAAEVVEVLQGVDTEEVEAIPDAAGSVNVTLTKWLSNSWNKQVRDFVFQWQLFLLESLEIAPTYYAWGLEKVNFVSYNKGENVYRVNLRARDVEISNDFWTGHSVIQYSETPNKAFEVLRTRWGYNSDQAADLNNATIANFVNSNWSSINPSDAQQDPVFNEMFDYGLDLTLNIAYQRLLFPSFPGNWTLGSLTAVDIQAKNDGNIYHMTVTLDGPNDYTANAQFAVLKKPDGNRNFINYGISKVSKGTA